MLTQERLHELLHYNPETGIFTWLEDRGRVKAGSVAGTIIGHQTRIIRVDMQRYTAARLAWLYMTGMLPTLRIDHEDGDPFNDAWSNLREATQAEVAANAHVSRRNRLGVKGVSAIGKRFRVMHRTRYLGTFDTLEEAEAAYAEAATAAFGPFARTS